MYDVAFDEKGERCLCEIDQIKYINRHIVNGTEGFYRVHFVKKSEFSNALAEYQLLINKGTNIYPNLIDTFYEDIWNYKKRVDLFRKEFAWHVRSKMRLMAITNRPKDWEEYKFDNFTLSFEKTEEKLIILADGFTEVEQPLLDLCNNDPVAKKEFSDLLKRFYHYSGDFEFLLSELPF